MENTSQKQKAIILLVIGTIFWGMTFVFIKEAVNSLSVSLFLFYRFALASLSLALVFYKRLSKINVHLIYKGVLLSIPLCIGFVTQTIGVKYTSASNAGFITGLSVVMVPVLVSLVEKKWPDKGTILAVVMATTGLALITLSSGLTLNIGDLWVLACAFAFALYIYMVSKESGKHDSILLTLVQLVVVTIFSLILSINEGSLIMPTNYLEWKGIIFCALFATTYMYTVQNHYQQFLTATSTAIIFSLEPLFAAITAFIVLEEEITLNIVTGGILILAGMLVSELYKKFSFVKC